ncbi:hypothetical protein N177_3920 [Lutibaculum baratangense AMV1]|uniref:Uncharacterized protein n=2 Tax=Lutibaculum TaxID=1358438 RepID=V4T861_9HYPH|nr:hypothetical protein N177_3920 [Lutibaculum baratangense AMV1]
MEEAVPDCLITGYEALTEALTLPDPDDRHVLAAAIVGKCSAIITRNVRDFPRATLASYDIEAMHPDDFIHHQVGLDRAAVIVSARNCRMRLRNPPSSAEQYVETLRRQGLPKTCAELAEYVSII